MNNQIMVDGQRGTIGANGVVNFSANDLQNVVFYTNSVLDVAESRERGKPWHVAKTYVRIQHPGERDYVDRPVADDDIAKLNWPRQWAAFEKKQEQAPDGTPVECLFPQAPEIAANLHSIAIHTIEQLAGLTSHGMQTVGMGGTLWQQKAKQFLDHARGGKAMHHLNLKVEQQESKIEALTNQNAMLVTQIDRLVAQLSAGVPPAMIPNGPMPVSQAHAISTAAHAKAIAAQQEWFRVPAPELSDEPLFVEVRDDDGLEGPSIQSSAPEPPKRGPGRPPKNRN